MELRVRPRRVPVAGESYADLLADRKAFEDFDADTVGGPGYGFGRLDQLAVEHLLGAR
jgi:xylose isomerase